MQIQESIQVIISFILLWSFFVVFVEALVELGLNAEPLESIRTFFSRRSHFMAGLLSCGYCFSVWVSFSIAWILPSPLEFSDSFGLSNDFTLFADKYFWWFINGVILHRLSNVFHNRAVKRQDFYMGGDENDEEA